MELKEFIKETLVQIMDGVKEAQQAVIEYGAIVNPENVVGCIQVGRQGRFCQQIDFDVTLAEIESNEKSTGIGVSLPVVGIGGKGQKNESTSSMTKIHFVIPVVLPSVGCNELEAPRRPVHKDG
jgi:hypothetical protein